jgi:hypothetical protein
MCQRGTRHLFVLNRYQGLERGARRDPAEGRDRQLQNAAQQAAPCLPDLRRRIASPTGGQHGHGVLGRHAHQHRVLFRHRRLVHCAVEPGQGHGVPLVAGRRPGGYARLVESDALVDLAAHQQQGTVDVRQLHHSPARQRERSKGLVGLHQFTRHGEQGAQLPYFQVRIPFDHVCLWWLSACIWSAATRRVIGRPAKTG